jgi:uncharacterized damage-inducible protein DinB
MTDTTITGDALDPVRHIAGRLRRVVHGPTWHGPAVIELLRDCSAGDAATVRVPGGHSIWEMVQHMTVWADIARARLDGLQLEYPDDAIDWPPVPVHDDDGSRDRAWRAAQDALALAYDTLAERTRQLDARQLRRRVPGQEYTTGVMLDGVIEHGAYHGGQVALLKRLVAGTHQ